MSMRYQHEFSFILKCLLLESTQIKAIFKSGAVLPRDVIYDRKAFMYKICH